MQIRTQKYIISQLTYNEILSHRGRFRGGDASPSGIRPPADPKGRPLVLFKICIFGRPTQKILKGAFGANI